MTSSTTHCLEVIFSIITIFVFKVQCDITILPDVLYYNLTTTSRTDLYVMQNKRQYETNTKALDYQLIEFKTNYNQRLETIAYHSDLIEARLNEVDNRLNPLELLDDINDHCVQKYRSKLPTLATIKANLATCMQQKGTGPYAALVSQADATLRNLKNYHANQFLNALKDCKKKFENMEANYTNCAMTAVKSTTTYTNTNTLTFENQLKTAACTATLRVKETFDCYAAIVFTTFNTIGEIMGLVDNCVSGREFSPSNVVENDTHKGRCPYHLAWHLSNDDMTSEKINNPFKGIGKTTPCLQINFITSAVALQ